MCSHIISVLYVFFILSCTTCYFRSVCSLFVLLFCSDTDTLRPCSTKAIGAIHRFPPPAAPQEPMMSLPFWCLLTSVPSSYSSPTPDPSCPSVPSSQYQTNILVLASAKKNSLSKQKKDQYRYNPSNTIQPIQSIHRLL